MTDQEQWTSDPLPSDAKLGTDDPDEERSQVEGPAAGGGGGGGGSDAAPVADDDRRADAGDDRNP